MVSKNSGKSIDERRKHLIEVLSGILRELCERNDPHSKMETIRNSFNINGVCLPKIKSYLMRIAHYTGCSEESLIFSLIYIDRLIANNAKFMVTSFNVHGLILTSILVAVKFYDDHHYKNTHFGKVGGISCKEMKRLEMIFLHEIKFELFVSKNIYKRYLKSLDEAIKRASKPNSPVEAKKGKIPVQAFSSKLITRFGTGTVKNIKNQKYANIISSRMHCEHQTYRDLVSKQIVSEHTKHRLGRLRLQPLYMPVRCVGTELPNCRNWQNSQEPLIGSAPPDISTLSVFILLVFKRKYLTHRHRKNPIFLCPKIAHWSCH